MDVDGVYQVGDVIFIGNSLVSVLYVAGVKSMVRLQEDYQGNKFQLTTNVTYVAAARLCSKDNVIIAIVNRCKAFFQNRKRFFPSKKLKHER